MEKYELLKQIGEGSFGQVFKARRKCDEAIVAYKTTRKKGRTDKELESLRRECEVHKNLSHPNIIQLFDSFETDSKIVVVTEFVERELYEMLRRAGKLSEERSQVIAWDLVSALHYLHSHRIVHRDIKPQNVLVDSTGVAKLCDFGFARLMSEDTHLLKSVKGTPLYMAPELIDESPYDQTVDLWSLGCIVYELVNGTPPFHTTSLIQLQSLVRHQSIKWPDHISPNCRSFLQGLLQKDASRRFTWPELLEHPFVKGRILMIDEGAPKPLTSPLTASVARAKQQQLNTLASRLGYQSRKLLEKIQAQMTRKSDPPISDAESGTSIEVLLNNLSLRASLRSDLTAADFAIGQTNCPTVEEESFAHNSTEKQEVIFAPFANRSFGTQDEGACALPLLPLPPPQLNQGQATRKNPKKKIQPLSVSADMKSTSSQCEKPRGPRRQSENVKNPLTTSINVRSVSSQCSEASIKSQTQQSQKNENSRSVLKDKTDKAGENAAPKKGAAAKKNPKDGQKENTEPKNEAAAAPPVAENLGAVPKKMGKKKKKKKKMERIDTDEFIITTHTETSRKSQKREKQAEFTMDPKMLQRQARLGKFTPDEDHEPIENGEWLDFLESTLDEVGEGEIATLLQENCVSVFVGPLRNFGTSYPVVRFICCLLASPYFDKIVVQEHEMKMLLKIYLDAKVAAHLVCGIRLLMKRREEQEEREEASGGLWREVDDISEEELTALGYATNVICKLSYVNDSFLQQFCDSLALMANGTLLFQELFKLEKRMSKIVEDLLGLLIKIYESKTGNAELANEILMKDRSKAEVIPLIMSLMSNQNPTVRVRICTLISNLALSSRPIYRQIWGRSIRDCLASLGGDTEEEVTQAASDCIKKLNRFRLYKW